MSTRPSHVSPGERSIALAMAVVHPQITSWAILGTMNNIWLPLSRLRTRSRPAERTDSTLHRWPFHRSTGIRGHDEEHSKPIATVSAWAAAPSNLVYPKPS